MITKNHAKEGLSRAYLQAVASIARVKVEFSSSFDYGIDGTFKEVSITRTPDASGKLVPRHLDNGYGIDFQLKCSINWKLREDYVLWSISTKTYNDLTSRLGRSRSVVLILMCLPKLEEDWLQAEEEALRMEKCCYYFSLSGKAPVVANSTKQIQIPRANILTPENLVAQLEAERARLDGLFPPC